MNSAIVRSGFDTWVGSAKASATHSKDKYLALCASGGAARAFIYFAIPAPRGATITKAELRLVTRHANPSATLTVERVTQNWKVGSTNWDNRPNATSTDAATATISSSSSGGQTPTFDVTAQVQTMVNGAPNYGFRINTSTTTLHYIYGIDSGAQYQPVLTVEWSDAPSTPTTLNPSEGTVGTPLPTLQFDYTDVSGDTTLSAVQVQIDPDADADDPAFDFTDEEAAAPELNLANTAFVGFDGTGASWRVRVQDGAGLWSGWSDWAFVRYEAKRDVTILSPADGVVYDTTPPVLWETEGQTSYQVDILDLEAGTPAPPLFYTSAQRPGAANSLTVTQRLRDGHAYRLEIRAWDDVSDRVATPGDPVYSVATTDFVVEADPDTDGVETLTATVEPGRPHVDLEWTRSTAPDRWTVYEDGVPVAGDLDPALLIVSGSTYRYRYHGAKPYVEHTYAVRAVVDGAMSPDEVTATAHTNPSGIWLVDPEDGLSVTLWGDEEGSWETNDDAVVYAPLGTAEPVRIVAGLNGLSGSIDAYLMEGFGQTFSDQEAALYALKSRPIQRLRLIVADESLEVLIGNVKVAPRPLTRKGRVMKAVSFDLWQVGQLPFNANI